MPKPSKPESAKPGETSANTLPIQTRAVPVDSVNVEDRTITITWTTGATVRRYDWRRDEPFDEVLVVDPAAIRMDRFNAGAPFLRDHNAYSIDAILGVIERAWIEGGVGKATVRFPKAEDDPRAD